MSRLLYLLYFTYPCDNASGMEIHGEALKTSGDSLNALEAGDAVQSSVLSLISSVPAKKLNCPITHLQHNSLSVVRQYIQINNEKWKPRKSWCCPVSE